METTEAYELNSTLRSTALNMDFLNYQQILMKAPQSDLDNTYNDSPRKEKVCYDSISEGN